MQTTQLFRSAWPGYEEGLLDAPFADLSIDSFDLMCVRTAIEEAQGGPIPDSLWLEFASFSDIAAYLKNLTPETERPLPLRCERHFHLGMPQLTPGGLSEIWLLKELGALHWEAIGRALGVPAAGLRDSEGHRLYATFLRVQWKSTHPLNAFREGESLTLRLDLKRLGSELCLGEASVLATAPRRELEVRLLSTFSRREARAGELKRARPHGTPMEGEDQGERLPDFVTEYQLWRHQKARREKVATFGYEPDPYQHFNGAGLLYFAVYPAIGEACERRYVHEARSGQPETLDWSLSASLLFRDIFYFSNCTLGDSLEWSLHEMQEAKGLLKCASSLHRVRDRRLLAEILSLKERHVA